MANPKHSAGYGWVGVDFVPPANYDNFTPTFQKYLKNATSSKWIHIVEVESPAGPLWYADSDCAFLGKIREFIEPTLLKVDQGNVLQIQLGAGKTAQGKISCTFDLDDNWRRLGTLALLNTDVQLKIGPEGEDVVFADFFTIFAGKITNVQTKDHQIIIEVSDYFSLSEQKFPEQKTYDGTNEIIPLVFRNDNIMTCLKKVMNLAVDATAINQLSLNTWASTWLENQNLNRVLTKPGDIKEYIDEIADEAGGYVYQVGPELYFQKVNPPDAGKELKQFIDDNLRTFAENLEYTKDWANKVIVYYDYNESGNEDPEDFQSAYVVEDLESQAEWDMVITKVLNRKWLRTHSWTQPPIGYYQASENYEEDATHGIVVYAVSYDNLGKSNYVVNRVRGVKNRLVYNARNENRAFIKWRDGKKGGEEEEDEPERKMTLSFMPPGTRTVIQSGNEAGRSFTATDATSSEDGWGPPVEVNKSGRYTLYGNDSNKWIKVWVNLHYLRRLRTAVGWQGITYDTTAAFVISLCSGNNAEAQARASAQNLIRRFGEPRPSIKFSTDIADGLHFEEKIVHAGQMVQVSTDRGFYKNHQELDQEDFLIIRAKHDFNTKRSDFDAVLIKLLGTGRYGFIGPDNLTRGLDATTYDDVAAISKKYAFSCDDELTVGVSSDEPYLIFPG